MMTDFFSVCNKVNVGFASDGMGGLESKYKVGQQIKGLLVPGSKSEHISGADGTVQTVNGVFHTFATYGLSHDDIILWRGKPYRLASDPIPCPKEAMDASWESFMVELLNTEVSP